MSKVIVIGGGAAGMMAAVAAAENGNKVVLVEKNEKIGKKVYITGKGRCNVTNACEVEELFQNVVSNPKFLYSAFYEFDNYKLMQFIEDNGCHLKIERGGRVFPVSDHASDVIHAFERKLQDENVHVIFHKKVEKLNIKDGKITGVMFSDKTIENADNVIVATGGISYTSTGSTGDGYAWARAVGHTIKECTPSLVPFCIKEEWCKTLQGLALKNVKIELKDIKRTFYEGFGEMLFTHFGVSGPLILSASSFYQKRKSDAILVIDLKPALSEEQLDKRILRDFEENNKKALKNALNNLFPAKLIPVMISLSGMSPEKKVYEITREERQKFVALIKHIVLHVSGTRDFNEAIITKGGIAVKEINPSTMESKLIKGLYFAGEVLDLDALTGGFNLQIAWSTGWLAGNSILP